ncbi:MAG: hypothetical protein FRX48_09468 [Lasallia pustulata]|uniref:Uncharacterized protein n=1 Tax=Lasallia pustulata TaxID=136370 RepID=A0A5M8PBY1_9LECA|nr:MAG: hypothetical protein FRX48_09468 [Lasallia pustulata]
MSSTTPTTPTPNTTTPLPPFRNKLTTIPSKQDGLIPPTGICLSLIKADLSASEKRRAPSTKRARESMKLEGLRERMALLTHLRRALLTKITELEIAEKAQERDRKKKGKKETVGEEGVERAESGEEEIEGEEHEGAAEQEGGKQEKQAGTRDN